MIAFDDTNTTTKAHEDNITSNEDQRSPYIEPEGNHSGSKDSESTSQSSKWLSITYKNPRLFELATCPPLFFDEERNIPNVYHFSTWFDCCRDGHQSTAARWLTRWDNKLKVMEDSGGIEFCVVPVWSTNQLYVREGRKFKLNALARLAGGRNKDGYLLDESDAEDVVHDIMESFYEMTKTVICNYETMNRLVPKHDHPIFMLLLGNPENTTHHSGDEIFNNLMNQFKLRIRRNTDNKRNKHFKGNLHETGNDDSELDFHGTLLHLPALIIGDDDLIERFSDQQDPGEDHAIALIDLQDFRERLWKVLRETFKTNHCLLRSLFTQFRAYRIHGKSAVSPARYCQVPEIPSRIFEDQFMKLRHLIRREVHNYIDLAHGERSKEWKRKAINLYIDYFLDKELLNEKAEP